VFGPGTTPGAGGSLPAEVRIAYDRRLLKAARPNLIHAQFANDRPIDKNAGTTMQMRRFELLAPATSPLSEGVTPTGNNLTVTPVTVGIAQYGDFIQVSDVLTWSAIDPILTQAADILGFQAGQTIDQLARDFMASGTNVIYATGKTARNLVTSTDKFTSAEIKKAVRTLEKSFTMPINGDYVGIVSPDAKYDIMSIPEWLAVKEYSTPKDLYEGELGSLYGVRFVESPLAKFFTGAGAGGIDVHATLIFGSMAFVKTEIGGESLSNIIKPLGSAGAADPLNQRATSGYTRTSYYKMAA
ncbi:MAG: N4-gp56 family major capsid protein, partial [Capsulimonas sp.]|uniref:N4-gp56 family major capsid protein n=1 Tax=Capsulimonas sp. TaxID=2494211 RepID=UPI0032678993